MEYSPILQRAGSGTIHRPQNFCKGMLKVTSPRKLLPEEEAKMDRAITDAIKNFRSIVPEGSKNWRLSITTCNLPVIPLTATVKS
jgi:hypothetical protein